MPDGPASRHLAHLATQSRPAGSTAAAEARAYCTDVLRATGFEIHERSFEYSAFPAAWAMPVTGVVASLSAVLLFLARRVPALGIAVLLLVGLVLVPLGVIGGRGVLGFPVMRRRGVNLEATRGGAEPRVWLVAHLDSKWQPVSMIARVVGVIGTALGLGGLTLLAVLAHRGNPTRAGDLLASIVLMLTWLASAPLTLSTIGDRNTGALDNASGVSAVLEAAESLGGATRVGVLITDAEELALAGGRAWARQRSSSVAIALNCDSVDDVGELTVMYTRSKPDALVSRLRAAATAQGERLRVIRLIPGILTDSVALADAGWETVTLSRGNARTLGRIHTSRDTLAHLRGTGIASTARVLARTATALADTEVG